MYVNPSANPWMGRRLWSVLSRLALWEALVIAAADSAACAYLVTEDLQDEQLIRGVRVKNPSDGVP